MKLIEILFFFFRKYSCSFYTHAKIMNKIKEKINAINPDIKFKKIWDVIFLVLSFLNFFILTLEICFFIGGLTSKASLSETYAFVYIIKVINFLFYGMDIILNFLTGYHIGGTMVMDLQMIRRKYISKLFVYDIIAYLPIFFFIFENEIIVISRKYLLINLLFFSNIKKFNKRLKEFKEFLIQEQEEFESIFSISVLYLRTLFISHILACVWYVIGTYNNTRPTWLTAYNIVNVEWESQYLSSLYWSLVTMVSVGYGDITPQNDFEKIYCIITILIGIFYFILYIKYQ